MAALRALAACLVFAALVSGCIAGPTSGTPAGSGAATQSEDGQDGSPASSDDVDGQTDDDQAGDGSIADPAPQASPSDEEPCDGPTVHGEPQRDDGTVDTVPETGHYVARRTVTIRNDFGGAERSDILLTTFNGAIAAMPSTDCDYHLVAELYGRGATPEDARQALDLLTLTATDKLDKGALGLSFVLTSDPSEAVPLPLGLSQGLTSGAILQLWLPFASAHDLETETSNAVIGVEGLHGPRLKATSSNAVLSVEGAFARLDLDTSNAALFLDGTFHDIVASTSNAVIEAELRPTQSGSVQLSTSSAAIRVGLPRDTSAFDITAEALNGNVRFDLEGHESSDGGQGTFQSSDWTSADVQVTMDLDTSNAQILVED